MTVTSDVGNICFVFFSNQRGLFIGFSPWLKRLHRPEILALVHLRATYCQYSHDSTQNSWQ